MDNTQNQAINNQTPKTGRIKTGWLLFKESWKILRSDETIFRFVIMSALFNLILLIIYLVVIVAGRHDFLSKTTTITSAGSNTTYMLNGLGLIPTVIYYIFAFFIVNIYAAGLAANVLDRFKGNKQSYGYYMGIARSKAGKLFVFSVLEATVGIILRAIAERVRILGLIIVSLIGAAWSIARLFVVPIIVNENESPTHAIKDSTKLIVSTWGENIVGRASMGGALFLFFILIMVPVSIILLLVGNALAGFPGVFGAGIIIFLGFMIYVIVSNAANGILNVALYYYAKNKQIPPFYDVNLLNSVFIHKKSKTNI